MIASWPGKIKPNSKSDHISAFWDVLPTLANIVEAKTPDNIDGISFLPTLLGENNTQKKHDYLYWEFHEKGGRQAVRKGIYDLSKDIGEQHDVALNNPQIVKEMTEIIKEARTDSDVFTFNQKTFLNIE